MSKPAKGSMRRIRAFEGQANLPSLAVKMPGLTHMYPGQEAAAVGMRAAQAALDDALAAPDPAALVTRRYPHA